MEQLGDHTLLAYSLSDSPGSWSLHGPDGRVTVTRPARVSANNSLLLRDLLVAGLGIGALPSFLAAPALASGQLQQVLADPATRRASSMRSIRPNAICNARCALSLIFCTKRYRSATVWIADAQRKLSCPVAPVSLAGCCLTCVLPR
ncbi:LysR substrate binding domain protein [compost metagenome]